MQCNANSAPRGLIAFLGPGTNNEAEITAGLLGFAYLACLAEQGESYRDLIWVCDSEYVLKSATAYIHGWQKNGWRTAAKKPVKNQGLWQAYLTLSKGVNVEPQHVRGHTGHPENEACDSAATWARDYAAEVLASEQSGVIVEPGSYAAEFEWHLIDARAFIKAMRKETQPSQTGVALLTTQLATITGGSGQRTSIANARESADGIEALVSSLRGIQNQAKSIGKRNTDAAKLAKALNALVEKFEK